MLGTSLQVLAVEGDRHGRLFIRAVLSNEAKETYELGIHQLGLGLGLPNAKTSPNPNPGPDS